MTGGSGFVARTAIVDLHETIKQFNKQSEKYLNRMLFLTWAILGLTLVMAVLAGIQVYLILNPSIPSP